MKQRLRRVTDLWVRGVTVEVGEDGDEPILLWVQKLSAAERSEAQRDGQFAAAKRRLSLTDDCDEMQIVRSSLPEYSRSELVDFIIGPKMAEAYRGAYDDVHAAEEWQEKLVLIERGSLEGEEGDDDVLAKVSAEYSAALETFLEIRITDLRDEYTNYTLEELHEAYLESYRVSRGMDAFSEAYEKTQWFFAIRDCHAVKSGEGWNHERCTHTRLCSDRSEVAALPDEVLEMVRVAFEHISMTEREAGN